MGYPTSDRKLGQAHLKMGQDRKLGCNIYINTLSYITNIVHQIGNQQVSLNSMATTDSLDVGQEVHSAHVGAQLALQSK